MQSKRLIAILSTLMLVVMAHAQVGQWTYKAHMLEPRADFAAVTANDGKIYVFGGSEAGTAEAYDPDSDTWSYIASPPLRMYNASAAKAGDGRMLITGYTGHSGVLTTYLYDPVTDSYTTAAVIGVTGGPSIAMALGNDRNIICYAANGINIDRSLWSYDLKNNVWTQLPAPPPSLPETTNAVSDANGLIYFSGGSTPADGGVASGEVWSYNDHTHAWIKQDLFLLNPRISQVTALSLVDGRIYDAGGGNKWEEETFDEAEYYDPASLVRSTIDHLQTLRRRGTAAADKYGRIYAFGGITLDENGSPRIVVDTVECYQPSLLRGTGDVISPVEGNPFSGEVGTFKDLGPTESEINYVATISWGDASYSTGVVTSGPTPNSFVVSGTHTYAKEGFYAMKIHVDDSDGDGAEFGRLVHVSDAPITGNAIDFSASSGVAFTRAVVHFEDANPLETATDFNAVVDWGDGTASETESVASNNSGGFDVRGNHTYLTPGTYTFIAQTAGKSFSGIATVTPPAPVVLANAISGVEGALFTGKVASFTNADPNIPYTDFVASIDWGDGSTSSGIVGPDFNVKGSHTYVKFGLYTLKVTVGVQGGASSSSNEHANITNAPITASGFNLVAKTTTFKDTVASFTDANPFGVVGDYTAAIFWGDGKSSVGTIVAAGAGFKVVGSHSYAKKGRYVVTVSVKDQGGATATATTQLNVGPVK